MGRRRGKWATIGDDEVGANGNGGQRAYALSELRRVRGVSQAELARLLAVAQPTVSKIEKGRPSMATVRRYVEALGGQVEVIAVFGDERLPLSV